jgi:pimeloyl-ACP methyl ester carboxylesterase
VAEQRSEKIDHLVYLSAFLIPNGESMLQTATTDAESLIVANLVFDEAGGTHMLKREAFREALYADCSDEDVALASMLLTPEPNAPVSTPLRLGAKFERVPRIYVECRRDRGVSPAMQKKMQARVGVTKSLALDTGHSPFFSAPAELVRLIIDG